jgi:hypothetical protein
MANDTDTLRRIANAEGMASAKTKLASGVVGILPVKSGGTGQSSLADVITALGIDSAIATAKAELQAQIDALIVGGIGDSLLIDSAGDYLLIDSLSNYLLID